MSLSAEFNRMEANQKARKPIAISPSKSYYRAMANLGNSLSSSLNEMPCFLSEFENKSKSNTEFDMDNLSDKLNSIEINDSPIDYTSPELSFSPTESIASVNEPTQPEDVKQNFNSPPIKELRRAYTVATPFPQSKALKRNNSYKPVTSHSYNSLPASDAVNFLSAFADISANQLTAVSPDEEGEEVGKYIMGKIIAKGAFSTVREAYTLNQDNQFHMLACKVIKKSNSNKCEEKVLEVENEVMLWKNLSHPNILRYVDMIDTSYAIFIFMELCPNGTLLDYVSSKGRLDEKEAKVFFLQLINAIRYLHKDAHIIHRDLKLENIVLSSTNEVKLTDFGLSVVHQDKDNTGNKCVGCAGSINYCAPELLKKDSNNNKFSSDVWALGIILYTLVVGKFPFSDGFEPRLVMKICNGKFELPESLSPSLRELILSMLNTDVNARPDITQVINSEWCQSS